MAKPAISSPFYGNYEPHDYLKQTIETMKDYCLPYGQVRIANPETGVIVALILYIIAKEPTVNRTKLECYIILLKHIVRNATGSELFKWTLNRRGRISNFSRFFDYMEGMEIIKPKGRSNFVIRNNANVKNILPRLNLILRNLLPYLINLLNKYEDSTAGEMLKEIQK